MDDIAQGIEQLLEEMVRLQRRKALELARRIYPRTTDDDLLSPQDIPALAGDPGFNYEDGLLDGYLAAQMAVRAWFRRREG